MKILQTTRTLVVSFLLLSVITGVLYPLLCTGLGQLFLKQQVNGSLIEERGQVRGSTLIGQPFQSPQYFWGRPSATANFPHNGEASGGSNLGPSNPALRQAVQERIQALHAADPSNRAAIPSELITASASGLDPHISPAAAEYQVSRVAKARGMTSEQVRATVKQYTQAPQWGIFGEERVNVLELNLALDRHH